MLLKRIQDFLKERGQACLEDIAAAVGADVASVEPMLELLEQKGRVKRIVMNARLCGGCTRCEPSNRVEWAWAGDS
jgi:predicted transcriptional regulator